MKWIRAGLFSESEDWVPVGARVWRGRAGSDDRAVSGLRVGEGVEEDGGDGAVEIRGSRLNSPGIAERVGLRGVRGGGWDGWGWRDGLGITFSVAAATESYHVGKGQTDETGTFAKRGDVCGDEFGGGGNTSAEQR